MRPSTRPVRLTARQTTCPCALDRSSAVMRHEPPDEPAPLQPAPARWSGFSSAVASPIEEPATATSRRFDLRGAGVPQGIPQRCRWTGLDHRGPLIRSTWPFFPQAVRRAVLLRHGQHDAAVRLQEALAVRVEVDGRPVTAPSGEWSADGRTALLMVAVCTGPTVGGGAAPAPDADPGDGLLDVLVSAATGPAERVALAAAPRGRPRRARRRRPGASREVRITGEAVEIDADG
jgi:YegS C-terminal NAD kinase beta sandwich-like domain